jgi:alkylhydroperoxidase family enzyme
MFNVTLRLLNMSDQIPRLTAKEMPPALASFLSPRIERLGYLGEFFQCTAHQPEALLSFLQFTEHLKHALPANLTEIVALSVAVLMDNDYERVQHERLCRKLGFSAEWLREVLNLGAGDQQSLTQEEIVVQRLAISVAQRGGRNTTPELEAVAHSIGPAQAIAVLMLIGRYMSHALIVNTLNLAPPPMARSQENGS